MKTTVEFLHAVKVHHHLHSDGRLAAKLGITRSAISTLMSGKNYMGDETAMHVADLLALDPAYVVACIHAERAKKSEEKKLWTSMATRLASVAAALALFVIFPGSFFTYTGLHTPEIFSLASMSGDLGSHALLGFSAPSSGTMYIMSNPILDIILLYWYVFTPLFAAMWYFRPRHNPPPKNRRK